MPRAHPNPILSLPKDSFTLSLARLDPANRALLDLSLRRGLRPEEISDLLGTDPESVIVAREAALEQLAAELGMADVAEIDQVRSYLSELPAEAWTGAPPPKLSVVKEEPPAVKPAEARVEGNRSERKSRLPLLLALLAIAAVVLVIALASSGGGDNAAAPAPKPQANKPAPAHAPASAPAPKPQKPPAGPKVKLAALGAAGATGTTALIDGGKRLRLDVRGLPNPRSGAYQVWLYDSVIAARSLTRVRGTKLALDLKLPAQASHYRYLDISLEPADGNPNHSGQSVLRVPLAKLSR
ncbi:MAG: hypothetical protein QOF55_2305 [Thermoleophilaceae bacterium]|nr:hypothetical protein [Thermoleophilaceae bacterium]